MDEEQHSQRKNMGTHTKLPCIYNGADIFRACIKTYTPNIGQFECTQTPHQHLLEIKPIPTIVPENCTRMRSRASFFISPRCLPEMHRGILQRIQRCHDKLSLGSGFKSCGVQFGCPYHGNTPNPSNYKPPRIRGYNN